MQTLDHRDLAEASNLFKEPPPSKHDPLDEITRKIQADIAAEKLRKAQAFKEELIKDATIELRRPDIKDLGK